MLVKEKIIEMEARLEEKLRDLNNPTCQECRLDIDLFFSHVDVLRSMFKEIFDSSNLNVAGECVGVRGGVYG